MLGIFRRKKSRKFGEIAIAKGLASLEDVQDALRIQKEYAEKNQVHKEIGIILIEKGVLTTTNVKEILEEQKGPGLMAWLTAFSRLSH